MAGITIDKLTKYFGSERAVDNISLEIEDGEFFVFVGPSGCGKSTLLRLIAGLVTPTSGNIKFDDRIVNRLEARDRNVAMVFQSYALYPHKNVYENVAFGLRARKTPKEQIDKRVDEAATMLGIQRLLNRWPKELSGGERQRVAIGRAIVRDPEVYLLDEPLSNLDAKLRIEMRNELAKIHRHVGTTFVYVTHDQVEAMTLGDRIAVLNEGRIEQIAAPEHLYDSPVNRFVAEFIGSPPMNFIGGRFSRQDKTRKVGMLVNDHFIEFEGEAFEGPEIEDHAGITLGIRPEAVKISMSPDFPLEVEVIRVEPIGHEGFIYFELYGSKLVARVSDWQRFSQAKRLYAGMNVNDVYLFLPGGPCIWGKGRRFRQSD
jgi:multiple sugar transport system ATP-binding protein